MYRHSDIEQALLTSNQIPEPWLLLDTLVREEMSFPTGDTKQEELREIKGTRTLSIRTPEQVPTVSEQISDVI
jgi:hypothetical protein